MDIARLFSVKADTTAGRTMGILFRLWSGFFSPRNTCLDWVLIIYRIAVNGIVHVGFYTSQCRSIRTHLSRCMVYLSLPEPADLFNFFFGQCRNSTLSWRCEPVRSLLILTTHRHL